MDTAKKRKGHGDTSSDTAVSLKKGDFITPSVISFFEKKMAA
jgi:ethanolamine utilization cobalamin adenosyltransferase